MLSFSLEVLGAAGAIAGTRAVVDKDKPVSKAIIYPFFVAALMRWILMFATHEVQENRRSFKLEVCKAIVSPHTFIRKLLGFQTDDCQSIDSYQSLDETSSFSCKEIILKRILLLMLFVTGLGIQLDLQGAAGAGATWGASGYLCLRNQNNEQAWRIAGGVNGILAFLVLIYKFIMTSHTHRPQRMPPQAAFVTPFEWFWSYWGRNASESNGQADNHGNDTNLKCKLLKSCSSKVTKVSSLFAVFYINFILTSPGALGGMAGGTQALRWHNKQNEDPAVYIGYVMALFGIIKLFAMYYIDKHKTSTASNGMPAPLLLSV